MSDYFRFFELRRPLNTVHFLPGVIDFV
uniref:Uncharacterized protein n=1 Tax=Anguilla anguilla TaxID=7936 RepID=A0A0E9VA43_ANGAN